MRHGGKHFSGKEKKLPAPKRALEMQTQEPQVRNPVGYLSGNPLDGKCNLVSEVPGGWLAEEKQGAVPLLLRKLKRTIGHLRFKFNEKSPPSAAPGRGLLYSSVRASSFGSLAAVCPRSEGAVCFCS